MDWEQLLADCVAFTQRLIHMPSMPFAEGEIAALIAVEMRALDFDEVWGDEAGNVYGRIYGQDRTLPTLVLNTHLDHVDPGDPSLWPVPPYSGEIVDDRIIGRGAADIKGPLAVQVYGMAALRRMGVRPPRDVVFTGVVQEEIGGAGAKFWVAHKDYEVALVILGEPSDNNLALGHRGIMQYWVQFNGRSVHASVPHKGQNPNYALADFLQKLTAAKDSLGVHPLLGSTTVTPTIIEVDTKSQNVTPAWSRVLLDFRTASESANSLQTFIQQLAGDWPITINPAWAGDVPSGDDTIYGYYTPPESEVVQQARALITEGMGREPALTSYQFATDGRHFVPYHIPIIGYSPAEEEQAHIAGESISIAKMADSLRGHVALLQGF
ncbi:MAG: M20/M25/M40 family metallo-hydrolase [Ardenticatenaceae bacterium]|nr:M20/M25/M40 family metallo-hydrolase [Anaerolineales bacterium]MCB8922216.1 M20/M25/M40 family metallo-hydrolase [Ardenticatenaceae bacterium]